MSEVLLHHYHVHHINDGARGAQTINSFEVDDVIDSKVGEGGLLYLVSDGAVLALDCCPVNVYYTTKLGGDRAFLRSSLQHDDALLINE